MTTIELLAKVTRLGIHLEAHDERLRFHPRSAVTPELADLLKAHKADLLVLLRLAPVVAVNEVQVAVQTDAEQRPTTKPVCRCGSSRVADVPIHGGRSIRRDCGRCGRFIDFPIWHGIASIALDAGGPVGSIAGSLADPTRQATRQGPSSQAIAPNSRKD